MKTFVANLETNEAFNKRINESYTRSINENTGLTQNERKKYRLGLKTPLRARNFVPVPVMPTMFGEKGTPRAGLNIHLFFYIFLNQLITVNYTNYMAPVKDQLSCGSCYTFAATAISEYYSRKKGENLTLSQQNLIDCDNSGFGCKFSLKSKNFSDAFTLLLR